MICLLRQGDLSSFSCSAPDFWNILTGLGFSSHTLSCWGLSQGGYMNGGEFISCFEREDGSASDCADPLPVHS